MKNNIYLTFCIYTCITTAFNIFVSEWTLGAVLTEMYKRPCTKDVPFTNDNSGENIHAPVYIFIVTLFVILFRLY